MIRVNKTILLVLVLLFSVVWLWAGSGSEAKGIHAAALKGDLVKVKAFLKKDASLLDSDGWHGKKPLHWAAQGGQKAVAEFLIAQGAAVDGKNEVDETPLHYAAAYGSKDVAEVLLANGAAVNPKAKYGTPLLYAAQRGQVDMVKLLISKGVDVKEATENGFTLLHHCAWDGTKEMIELLVDNGIPADAKTDFGRTPLQMAALHGNVEAAKVLIKKGADVNHKGEEDWPPLYLAAKRGHKDFVGLLLESRAAVDVTGEKSKRTPLHLAALNGYGEIAAMLMEKGADPNAEDINGKTPLYYAARYSHKKVAKNLISRGVKVENLEKLKEKFGYSPILKKQFEPGHALAWYLGHSGWAIKTANYLLIFDYYKQGNLPDTPLITNGTINTEEIKDLNVVVFASHAHGDHYMPSIFDWRKDIQNITYIMGFKPEKQSDYIYMGPRETKKVNGLEVTTIESNDSGVGFFVQADGVNIFHSGDHANRKQDFSGPFKKEIEFLADRGLTPDIFFAPVSGCGFGDLESVKKGVYYTVKTLSPKAVFPMHALGSEERYVEFAKEARKAGIEGPFCCAGHSGDWFFINQGSVKKAYTLHNAGYKHKGDKEGEKKGDKKVCKKKQKEKKQK